MIPQNPDAYLSGEIPLRLTELAHFLGFEIGRLRDRRRAAVFVVPAPSAPPETLLRIDPASTAVFWRPPEGPALVGMGEALRLDLSGPGRFAALDAAAAALWSGLPVVAHPDAVPFVPSLLGGFSFEPGGADATWKGFGDGCFVLPRWTYIVGEQGAALALALHGEEEFLHDAGRLQRFERIYRALSRPPEPPATPPRRRAARTMEREEWTALVEDARREIEAGRLRKVVVARRTDVEFDGPLDPASALARLRAAQGGTYLFALRRGAATFFGATPETLLVKRGLAVRSEALAGTAPRAEGEADSAAATFLAANAKDLAEHRAVVEGINDALAPFCRSLTAQPAPSVRTLRDVHHLSTPLDGQLLAATPLPRLLEAVHPTPAMGGAPRDAALDFLRRREPAPRGWYAAPFGRLGADGDGEFAAAIRSAIVRGDKASFYAGAGIVAASDAAREFEEIAAKERTIGDALGI